MGTVQSVHSQSTGQLGKLQYLRHTKSWRLKLRFHCGVEHLQKNEYSAGHCIAVQAFGIRTIRNWMWSSRFFQNYLAHKKCPGYPETSTSLPTMHFNYSWILLNIHTNCIEGASSHRAGPFQTQSWPSYEKSGINDPYGWSVVNVSNARNASLQPGPQNCTPSHHLLQLQPRSGFFQ